MLVKLLIEHYLAFLSLKGGCIGSCQNAVIVGNRMLWLKFSINISISVKEIKLIVNVVVCLNISF